MSAVTLLGTPAELYQFGSIYLLIAFAFMLVMPSTNYLYLPIFFKLQVTSAYEVSCTHSLRPPLSLTTPFG